MFGVREALLLFLVGLGDIQAGTITIINETDEKIVTRVTYLAIKHKNAACSGPLDALGTRECSCMSGIEKNVFSVYRCPGGVCPPKRKSENKICSTPTLKDCKGKRYVCRYNGVCVCDFEGPRTPTQRYVYLIPLVSVLTNLGKRIGKFFGLSLVANLAVVVATPDFIETVTTLLTSVFSVDNLLGFVDSLASPSGLITLPFGIVTSVVMKCIQEQQRRINDDLHNGQLARLVAGLGIHSEVQSLSKPTHRFHNEYPLLQCFGEVSQVYLHDAQKEFGPFVHLSGGIQNAADNLNCDPNSVLPTLLSAEIEKDSRYTHFLDRLAGLLKQSANGSSHMRISITQLQVMAKLLATEIHLLLPEQSVRIREALAHNLDTIYRFRRKTFMKIPQLIGVRPDVQPYITEKERIDGYKRLPVLLKGNCGAPFPRARTAVRGLDLGNEESSALARDTSLRDTVGSDVGFTIPVDLLKHELTQERITLMREISGEIEREEDIGTHSGLGNIGGQTIELDPDGSILTHNEPSLPHFRPGLHRQDAAVLEYTDETGEDFSESSEMDT